MNAIQKATLEARKATGDDMVGTTFKKGKVAVVRFKNEGGSVMSYDNLSGFVTAAEAVKFLESMSNG